MRRPIPLRPNDSSFPAADLALRDPNGLLAIGGDLTPARLLSAYRQGIFPWFSDDAGPILWWSPDPRAVIAPEAVNVSRSLRRTLDRDDFDIRLDTAFEEVIRGCASPRNGDPRTWITPAIREAYCALHRLGYAHSAEAWVGGEIVGGLYGVSIGRIFFGESMFARRSNASKAAFVRLVAQLKAWQFDLIDCQVMNPHLASLGAIEMPRREFLTRLRNNPPDVTRRGPWRFDER
jgi:leucyl/phenylalanyl-tRNA--protein transferase